MEESQNKAEAEEQPIGCSYCGAVDKWKGEEYRDDNGDLWGKITCTNCGKADSGFFIGEFKEGDNHRE